MVVIENTIPPFQSQIFHQHKTHFITWVRELFRKKSTMMATGFFPVLEKVIQASFICNPIHLLQFSPFQCRSHCQRNNFLGHLKHNSIHRRLSFILWIPILLGISLVKPIQHIPSYGFMGTFLNHQRFNPQ